MSKYHRLNPRQLAREKLLFRYSSALERGDFETVALILRAAESDFQLATMLAEMDAIYAQETHPIHSMQTFSSNNHHEDYPMNTTYAVHRQSTAGRWPSVTLLAAIAATIIIGVALVTLPRFYPQEENIGAVSNQQQATPTPIASLTPTPIPLIVQPASFFEYGGHVNDLTNVATNGALRLSGMTWVKFQVEFNPDQSSVIDVIPLIAAAHDRGFRVLLMLGPRLEDIQRSGETPYQQQFINFLVEVAKWHPDAIEVWQEPNIDRWWPTNQISGQSYVNLLEQAYRAIKQANPDVMVISAAPAPTSAGNEFPGQIVNDDRWLQEVVSAGGLQWMDCLGAHYVEGVVSPLATSGDPRDNLYTRYFSTMFDTYWNITGGQKPICWTELGYLAPEGSAPPDSFIWAMDTTGWEQGVWLAQATALSARSGRVRLMIVWNVDFNTVNTEMPGYAIIRPDGSCPACEALAAVGIALDAFRQVAPNPPPNTIATIIPLLSTPILFPTPTAYFDSALRQGNVSLMTTSPIDDLLAGTRVKIKSAFFDGASWSYEVETEDGRLYQAFEWQLVQPINPPATLTPTHTASFTPTPTPPILCRVTNLNGAEIRVRFQADTNARVIGFLPPNTIADVIRQERSSADSRVWYLIAAQIEDNRIEGWVLNDTVTQVANCPAFQ